MKEVQKWVDEHDIELSLIANAYGLNQAETIIKVLKAGIDKNMDEVSDMMIAEF